MNSSKIDLAIYVCLIIDIGSLLDKAQPDDYPMKLECPEYRDDGDPSKIERACCHHVFLNRLSKKEDV